MKNQSQSPSHSPSKSKEGDKLESMVIEESTEEGKDVSKSTNKDVFGNACDNECFESEFEDNEGSEEEKSSDSAPVEISHPPQIQPTLQLEIAPMPIVNQWGYIETHELYELDSVIVPNIGKPKKGFFLEPKLLIVDRSDMLQFES